MLALIATIASFIIALYIGYSVVLKPKSRDAISLSSGVLSMKTLLHYVQEEIAELVKDDNFAGSTEYDYQNALSRKDKVRTSLKKSTYGLDSAKEVVIDIIYSIVCKHCPKTSDLCAVIPFDSDNLEPNIKFEILMYHFKRKLAEENLMKSAEERVRNPSKDAFKAWVKKYKLDEPKYIIEDGEKASYVITPEEVDETYEAEQIELQYTDMAKIISILLFQRYRGFGCIDTVRALDVNGLTIGTSGSILTYLREQKHVATDSVWVNLGGKYIHLRFLGFGSHEELRRVVQLLARYNSPGPLTEKRGYLVNNMYDESRILAVRPPFAESWGAFIRKFGADHKTLKFLIYKDYISNWMLPFRMIQFLMKGQITTSFTGRQGCGKTTMMTAAIEFMDPRHNLRVIEMAFEMNTREHYPERNVMTFQETEFLDAHHAQDAQKKSDGAVSLFGEVATDAVAARMLQTGRVASLFTIFSHHGKTALDTVYALADSIVAATGMRDRSVAEKQVVDVLRLDVHLDYTADGKYYIERVTEIIKLPEGVPYPDIDESNLELSKLQLEREFYTRSTDRKTFTTRDLIKYDLDTDTYYTVNPPSEELVRDMLRCLNKQEQAAFTAFLADNFNHTTEKTEKKTGQGGNFPKKSPLAKGIIEQVPSTKGMKKSAGFSRAGLLAEEGRV